MLLKGILLIFIGISGIVITMTWIFKSFNKSNRNKSNFSHKIQENSFCTAEISDLRTDDQMILNTNIKPLEFYFQTEEAESTVLLDDSVIDEETDETVLLKEEKLRS